MAKKTKKGLEFDLVVTTVFDCGDELWATKDGIWYGDGYIDGCKPTFTWADIDAFLKEASKLRPAKKGG